jgi:predicted RNA-binding protein with PUA-like domain
MKYWLMKTEPDVFSWADLEKMPSQTTKWEGVRNYQARNLMRDEFRVGDRVFFYHSRQDEPGIVGIAQVVREAYPDDTALDSNSPYCDLKSIRDGVSRWVMVDIKLVQPFAHLISLKELKSIPELKGMALLRPGQRLSVQPVAEKEWHFICSMAGICSIELPQAVHESFLISE